MSDKWTTHPDGSRLFFRESDHTYSIGDRYLIPATSLIHSFFPEFDEDKHSLRIANREGRTQEEVLDEWEGKRTRACDFGTKVHSFAEMYLKGEDPPEPDTDKEKLYFKWTGQCIRRLQKNYEIVAIEETVFSEDFGVAGTVDLVAKNLETGQYAILDWKTNEKIKETNTFAEGTHGLGPCSDIYNCNYWHYVLQINLYRVLLALEGYYPCEGAEMAFLHIGPMGVKRYDLPRMDKIISQMLIDNRGREYHPSEEDLEVEDLFD